MLKNKVFYRTRNSRRLNNSSKAGRNEPTINARDIILSIFNQETDGDKLQYTKSKWAHSSRSKRSGILEASVKTVYQPLKYLFPFLQKIANNVDIDTCSYIFVDRPLLRVVHRQSRVKIEKDDFNCAKIKYWLSHIYFSRYRRQFAQKILEGAKNTSRDTINQYEEKEYMPKVLRGIAKQSAPFVRKISVSPDRNFRRNGEAQKTPFCIVYNKNGSQQELNFSEVLGFVEYPFNLSDIIYIKILPTTGESRLPITLRYSKQSQTRQQQKQLIKFRSIFSRIAGWQLMREEVQQKKQRMIQQKLFDDYCAFLVLQAVAFIEIKWLIKVDELQTEWVISQKRGVILTNVSMFSTSQTKIETDVDGLATLYEKVMGKAEFKTIDRQAKQTQPYRYKRFKSQQKQSFNLYKIFNQMAVETPKKVGRKSKRLQQQSTGIFASKGKSCMLTNANVLLS